MSVRPGAGSGAPHPAAAHPRATRPAGRPGSGPARPAPPVEPARVEMPRLLSARVMVMGVVALMAFILVFPTLRSYLQQSVELAQLEAQVTAAEQRNADLEAELDRWSDPSYVVAQARERLAFVMPGETAYHVVDPEVVREEVDASTGVTGLVDGTAPGAVSVPWYTVLWGSVTAAGEAGAVAEPTPAPGTTSDGTPTGQASDGTGQVSDGAGQP